jgi:hypothetical protein
LKKIDWCGVYEVHGAAINKHIFENVQKFDWFRLWKVHQAAIFAENKFEKSRDFLKNFFIIIELFTIFFGRVFLKIFIFLNFFG